MRHDSSSILELDGKEVSVFTPSKPREKWQRKRTHVKLRVRGLLGAWAWACCPVEPSRKPLVTDETTESQAVLFNPQSVALGLLPHLWAARLPNFPKASD